MNPPPLYPPASFGSPQPGQPPHPMPRRRPLSFWLAIVFGACTLVGGFLFLLVSVGMAGMSGLGGAAADASRLQERVVEGSGRPKIAWIPVHGVILESEASGPFSPPDMVGRVLKSLEQATDDPDVKAIVLDVDSPGGGVTASDRIHHEVLKAREAGKKVVVLMGDVAASGGYYVSAPADWILAHPTTVTGSIGVIGQFLNVEGLVQKIGVREETFKSGAHKDIGSMTRTMTSEEREIFQALINDMYEQFLGVVLDGRSGVKLPEGGEFTEAHLRKVADGRIYTATQALQLGLIDGTGYREDAVATALQLAGEKQARVIEYFRQPSLADLFSARAPSSAISLDARWLRQVSSPRILYLWSAP